MMRAGKYYDIVTTAKTECVEAYDKATGEMVAWALGRMGTIAAERAKFKRLLPSPSDKTRRVLAELGVRDLDLDKMGFRQAIRTRTFVRRVDLTVPINARATPDKIPAIRDAIIAAGGVIIDAPAPPPARILSRAGAR